MSTTPLPGPRPPPDPLADDVVVLLDALVAGPTAADGALRARLIERVARSARASRDFLTVRRDAPAARAGAGVACRTLYAADTDDARRLGEPERVVVVELGAGARWSAPAAPGCQREWLVMAGSARIGALALRARDWQRGAAEACAVAAGPLGARLYVREARVAAAAPAVCRDADAGWDDFAPGIRRRVLWTDGGEAAMLYHAAPGAAVPGHGHGRDEECLMLDGELFLDDQLLRCGDWQLAPAGSAHAGVDTDTGVVVYAHGDLDLDVR